MKMDVGVILGLFAYSINNLFAPSDYISLLQKNVFELLEACFGYRSSSGPVCARRSHREYERRQMPVGVYTWGAYHIFQHGNI